MNDGIENRKKKWIYLFHLSIYGKKNLKQIYGWHNLFCIFSVYLIFNEKSWNVRYRIELDMACIR